MLRLLTVHAPAEAIGTFSMVFVGAGSVLLAERGHLPAFCVPLVWGGIIAAMIFAFAAASGAHFNPAVTLAFAAMKRIPAPAVPVYWAAQAAGGLAAVCVLRAAAR